MSDMRISADLDAKGVERGSDVARRALDKLERSYAKSAAVAEKADRAMGDAAVKSAAKVSAAYNKAGDALDKFERKVTSTAAKMKMLGSMRATPSVSTARAEAQLSSFNRSMDWTMAKMRALGAMTARPSVRGGLPGMGGGGFGGGGGGAGKGFMASGLGRFGGGALGLGGIFGGTIVQAAAAGIGDAGGLIGGAIPLAGAGLAGGAALGGLYGTTALGGMAMMKGLTPAVGARMQAQQVGQQYGTGSQEYAKAVYDMNQQLKQQPPAARAASKSMIDLYSSYLKTFSQGERGVRQYKVLNEVLSMAHKTILPGLTKAWDAMFPVVEKNMKAVDKYFGSAKGKSEAGGWGKMLPQIADDMLKMAGAAVRLGGGLVEGFSPLAKWMSGGLAKWLGDKADWANSTAGLNRMAQLSSSAKPMIEGLANVVRALGTGLTDLLTGNSGKGAAYILDHIAQTTLPAFVKFIDKAAANTPAFVNVLSKLAKTFGNLFGPNSALGLGLKMLDNLSTLLEKVSGVLGTDLGSTMMTAVSAMTLGRTLTGGKGTLPMAAGLVGSTMAGVPGMLGMAALGGVGQLGMARRGGGGGIGGGVGGSSAGGLSAWRTYQAGRAGIPGMIAPMTRLDSAKTALAGGGAGKFARNGGLLAGAGLLMNASQTTGTGGQIQGALGGAMSGAAAGSMILPGWGTAIGALAGGIGGYFLGGSGAKDKPHVNPFLDPEAMWNVGGAGHWTGSAVSRAGGSRPTWDSSKSDAQNHSDLENWVTQQGSGPSSAAGVTQHSTRKYVSGLLSGTTPGEVRSAYRTQRADFRDQQKQVGQLYGSYRDITTELHKQQRLNKQGKVTNDEVNATLAQRKAIVQQIAAVAPESVSFDRYGAAQSVDSSNIERTLLPGGHRPNARSVVAAQRRARTQRGIAGRAGQRLLDLVPSTMRTNLDRALKSDDQASISAILAQASEGRGSKGRAALDTAFSGYKQSTSAGTFKQMNEALQQMMPLYEKYVKTKARELALLREQTREARHHRAAARRVERSDQGSGHYVGGTFVLDHEGNRGGVGAPAKTPKGAGEKTAAAQAKGIDAGRKTVVQAQKATNEAVTQTMDSGAVRNASKASGTHVALQFRDGMAAGRKATNDQAKANLVSVMSTWGEAAESKARARGSRMGKAFAAGIKQAVNEVKAAARAISDAAGSGVDSGGGTPPAAATPATGNPQTNRRPRTPRTPRRGGRIYGDFAPGLPHTNLNAVAFRSGGNVGHKAAKHAVAQLNAQAASGPSGGGAYSTSGLVPQVKRALAWARAHGWSGSVNSGFRTRAEQEVLYARYLAGGNLAAPPGQSNHESGRAVDVSDIPGFQRAMASAPANARLKWFGPGDAVHFSVDGHRRGGRIHGFAGGGRVPGTRRAADSVDAMLSPQEFVVTADGERILEKMTGVRGVLNQLEKQQKPHFAGGGRVAPIARAVVTGKPGSGRGVSGHGGKVEINFHGDINVRNEAEYDAFVERLTGDLEAAFANTPRDPEELVA